MSDLFPNNKIKSGSPFNLNITIIYSEFNSEIVTCLLYTSPRPRDVEEYSIPYSD